MPEKRKEESRKNNEKHNIQDYTLK